VRNTWFSSRAILLHLLVLVLIPTFAALCDWQVHRALSGNELSWAYVFEWPFFGVYALYMWWRFIHEPPAQAGTQPHSDAAGGGEPVPANGRSDAFEQGISASEAASETPRSSSAPSSDEVDDELAAYNRYLAQLDARGDTKHW
jgi:hypothetical protein